MVEFWCECIDYLCFTNLASRFGRRFTPLLLARGRLRALPLLAHFRLSEFFNALGFIKKMIYKIKMMLRTHLKSVFFHLYKADYGEKVSLSHNLCLNSADCKSLGGVCRSGANTPIP